MHRLAVFVAMFFVLAPIHMAGQTINATLGGTVSDTTGALIPGVAITATNAATGIALAALALVPHAKERGRPRLDGERSGS